VYRSQTQGKFNDLGRLRWNLEERPWGGGGGIQLKAGIPGTVGAKKGSGSLRDYRGVSSVVPWGQGPERKGMGISNSTPGYGSEKHSSGDRHFTARGVAKWGYTRL